MGGKDGRFEYRGRFVGEDRLTGTYYCFHDEGVELECDFNIEGLPAGVPARQRGTLDLRRKTFQFFLSERPVEKERRTRPVAAAPAPVPLAPWESEGPPPRRAATCAVG